MPAAAKSAAAPESGRWVRLVHVVKHHPLMAVVSVLGTLTTFVVGTAKLTGLVVGSGAVSLGPVIPVSEIGPVPGSSYGYVTVSDETGQISVDVPTAWGNVLRNGWHAHGLPPFPEDAPLGPGVNAAPNVAAWKRAGDFRTPGIFVGASETVIDEYAPDELLQRVSFGDECQSAGGAPYTNDDFAGATLTWTCPNGSQWRVLAATPKKSHGYLVYVQVKLVSAADVEAYNRVVRTFDVDFDS
jgi:hypothetical protein